MMPTPCADSKTPKVMETIENKFSFYYAPVREVRYVKEADIYGIYRYISDPRYAKHPTDTLRAIADEDERKLFKSTHFAYCLFSGTFGTNRRNDGLQHHSGLLCLDFDHLQDLETAKRQLLSDPYFETLLLFVSPSGTGLKWVIPIGNELAPMPHTKEEALQAHELWFQAVANYLQATYSLTADPACRNVARACFLPHDPDCYIAPRLHRPLAKIDNEATCPGALLKLATSLAAANIDIVSLHGDNIAVQNADNHAESI